MSNPKHCHSDVYVPKRASIVLDPEPRKPQLHCADGFEATHSTMVTLGPKPELPLAGSLKRDKKLSCSAASQSAAAGTMLHANANDHEGLRESTEPCHSRRVDAFEYIRCF